jgi:2-polyprenyl-3-methyl-5-hydroxy-6-metoxy-1,4-benzoquinol methylase
LAAFTQGWTTSWLSFNQLRTPFSGLSAPALLLDVMVSRLEARGNHWFFQKVLREYLDAMDIDAASTVLDMGCGTGVAARTVARRANFSGRVTGVDLSPYLVEAAKCLAEEEGLGSRVEFRSGNTRDLDAPNGRFDVVVAHTLVSHVQEALTVLKEEQAESSSQAD